MGLRCCCCSRESSESNEGSLFSLSFSLSLPLDGGGAVKSVECVECGRARRALVGVWRQKKWRRGGGRRQRRGGARRRSACRAPCRPPRGVSRTCSHLLPSWRGRERIEPLCSDSLSLSLSVASLGPLLCFFLSFFFCPSFPLSLFLFLSVSASLSLSLRVGAWSHPPPSFPPPKKHPPTPVGPQRTVGGVCVCLAHGGFVCAHAHPSTLARDPGQKKELVTYYFEY